jgi:hypothetical protein
VSDSGVASDNSALMLLLGILMSGNAWQDVVPLLSNHHQVYTATTAGHRGGPSLPRSPATSTIWSTPWSATSTSVISSDRILPASLWAVGWPSSWPGGAARQPCARWPRGFLSAGDSEQARVKKQIHARRRHVPMVDDPDLLARTILAVTGAG